MVPLIKIIEALLCKKSSLFTNKIIYKKKNDTGVTLLQYSLDIFQIEFLLLYGALPSQQPFGLY